MFLAENLQLQLRPHKPFPFIAFVIFLLFNQVLLADEFTSEGDFLNTIPIIYSSTRLNQHFTDSPSSITVIDRETIKASGAIEIADLMRLVPGMQVAYLQNNEPIVTSHGLAATYERRIQIVIDGRQVNLPLRSSIDWNSLGISLEDIEKIEIIRGAGASSYGSNSFNVAINIATNKDFYQKNSVVSILGGSTNLDSALDGGWPDLHDADEKSVHLSQTGSLSGIHFRASADYEENDGFIAVNDSKRLGHIFIRSEYNPTQNDAVDLEFGTTFGELGVFTDPADPAFDIPRNRTLNTNFQKISWLRGFGQRDLSVQFYHNWYSQKDRKTLGTLRSVLHNYYSYEENQNERQLLLDAQGTSDLDQALEAIYSNNIDRNIDIAVNDGVTQNLDLEVQLRSNKQSMPIRFVVGSGLRFNRIRSDALLGRHDFVSEILGRVFSIIEWQPIVSTCINSGIVMEAGRNQGILLSPNIGMNIHLSKKHHLRAGIARAYRAPSLLENNVKYGIQFSDSRSLLDVRTLAADNLQPESMTSYELGYIGDYRNYDITYDFKVFHEEIRNGIFEIQDNNYSGDTLPVDSKVRYWDNVVNANINGVEFQFDYRPNRPDLFRIQYSYTRCSSCTYREVLNNPKETGDYSNIAGSVPKHSASLLAQKSITPDTNISVAYYKLAEMNWMESSQSVPGYDRWDFAIGYHLKRARYSGDLRLIMQNLLENYQEFRVYNNFERRIYLKARLAFR